MNLTRAVKMALHALALFGRTVRGQAGMARSTGGRIFISPF
jgi:hypothetical protein